MESCRPHQAYSRQVDDVARILACFRLKCRTWCWNPFPEPPTARSPYRAAALALVPRRRCSAGYPVASHRAGSARAGYLPRIFRRPCKLMFAIKRFSAVAVLFFHSFMSTVTLNRVWPSTNTNAYLLLPRLQCFIVPPSSA